MSNKPRHHLPASLSACGDEMLVGGIAIRRLAERVGSTPFYAYDRTLMRERVVELREHLPSSISLHYAMKANPMPAVVQHMATLVDGLDVASTGEMRVALDTGMPADKVSFAGPGKREQELHQAIAAGITVNVESQREVDIAAQYCERSGYTARLAVRVNPAFELKSSGMQMGGGPKVFGIDEERVPSVISDIIARGLHFEGLHIFAGSQNLRAQAVADAQSQCLALGLSLARQANAPLTTLNIGGGLGIPYFPGEQPLALEQVGSALDGELRRHGDALNGVEVVMELGRFLVGEAGYYVCRITDRKISRDQVFLVTDGGLHQHLAASGNFGQVIRKNYPVVVATKMSQTTLERVDVVGPLCTPLDVLAKGMELPYADVGDLIAVLQSGAYGLSSSPTRFLGHPPPLEILV